MRKIVSLFLLVAAFASCENNVKFSTPGLQAKKNGVVWKAEGMGAYNNPIGITIVATVGSETITLHTRSAAPGDYVIGTDAENSATFVSSENPSSLYEAKIGVGSGKIHIGAGDTSQNLSGTFYFVAKNAGGEAVNFTEGVFYKVAR